MSVVNKRVVPFPIKGQTRILINNEIDIYEVMQSADISACSDLPLHLECGLDFIQKHYDELLETPCILVLTILHNGDVQPFDFGLLALLNLMSRGIVTVKTENSDILAACLLENQGRVLV